MEGAAQTVPANWWAAVSFIGYLAAVVFAGLATARFSSSGMTEFFLGGRKVSRFVVALSAVVSGRSAWLLLGLTGMAYKMGAQAVWAAVGYIVVELFLFLFYARRLRRFSEAYDCITLPDFFAARFNDDSGALRKISVFIILIFMVSYVSAQFVGGGKAFAASFSLDQTTGIFLTAGIVLFYTILGGFMAVSVTDVLQAVLMIVALILLPVTAIAAKGGLHQVIAELAALNPKLINPFAIAAGAGIGFAGIGLGSPGNPHILVRYMSISDPDQLRISAIVGTTWNVLMAWGALFIGLVGRVYFPEANMLPGGDTENLFPALAQRHLHPALFGIVAASIFAAIMSTADSQLLVAASGIVRDIYEKLINQGKALPQKKLVLYSRIVIALLTLAALFLGMAAGELVFWLVLFAWAGLGASLGPASILALYWKRATKAGIIAGLISGAGTAIIWYYTPCLKSALYELIPAFIVGALTVIIVSLFTNPPDDVDNMFDIMKGND